MRVSHSNIALHLPLKLNVLSEHLLFQAFILEILIEHLDDFVVLLGRHGRLQKEYHEALLYALSDFLLLDQVPEGGRARDQVADQIKAFLEALLMVLGIEHQD